MKIEEVLDLTDPGHRRRLPVTKKVLIDDSDESLEMCRRIADWARSEGHAAILAPSAASRGGEVLAIYPDVSPEWLELDHIFHREPM